MELSLGRPKPCGLSTAGPPELILSPAHRLILTLGVTQIVGYGTLYYAFGVLVPLLAADIGVSQPFAFGAFSAALLAGGAVAPFAGRQIDRIGARKVMAAGSAAAGLALALLSQVTGGPGLILALICVEAAAALVLYDAAFAALALATGPAGARRAITLMTLLGGFASTVFWPLTYMLMERTGWRETYLIFAALHLFLCLPLHLSLPRLGITVAVREPARPLPDFAALPAALRRRAMVWLAAGFSLAAVVLSALAAQWVPALMALGLSSTAAVAAGVLMGPAQVGVRVIDLYFGVRHHPMTMALLSTGLLAAALLVLVALPAGTLTAMIFATLYGLSGGLTSIVRVTVPLALFGAAALPRGLAFWPGCGWGQARLPPLRWRLR